MTFVTLFHDPAVFVATDQLVLDADEVQAVTSATRMARRMTEQLGETEERLRQTRQRAYDDGFAAGREAGLKAAREETAAELVAMAARAQRQQEVLRGAVVRLALQVVRKIAAELGPSETVAALAHTAVSNLMPGITIRLWVNPSVEETVRARFAEHDATESLRLEIRTDETLNPYDCILGTDSGQILAGLEVQLKTLEKVLTRELVKEGSGA